jgi:hypothetical protein
LIVNVKTNVYLGEVDITDYVTKFEITNELNKAFRSISITIKDYKVPENATIVNCIINNISNVFKVVDLQYGRLETTLVAKSDIYNTKIVYETDDLHSFIGTNTVTNCTIPLDLTPIKFEERLEQFYDITRFMYYWNDGIKYVDFNNTFGVTSAVFSVANQNIKEIVRIEGEEPQDIKGVGFNLSSEEYIYSEPSMTLFVNPSPQPFSPSTQMSYSDGNSTYFIDPVYSKARLYYSPLGDPKITASLNFAKRVDYKVVEKFNLDNDEFAKVTGFIKSVISIEINDVVFTSYTHLYNHILFNTPQTGDMKIAYITDIYEATIPPTTIQKKTKIKAEYYNHILEAEHNVEASGYFPIPYTFTINFIDDYNIESNIASGMLVEVLNSSVVVAGGNADAFGEIDITINDYGCYALLFDGRTYYINFFSNEFNISPNVSKKCQS